MNEEKVIRCFICKRRLRGLKARAMGVGPTCAKKHPDRVGRFLVEQAGQQQMPFDEVKAETGDAPVSNQG